jgi:hypothetical protein
MYILAGRKLSLPSLPCIVVSSMVTSSCSFEF